MKFCLLSWDHNWSIQRPLSLSVYFWPPRILNWPKIPHCLGLKLVYYDLSIKKGTLQWYLDIKESYGHITTEKFILYMKKTLGLQFLLPMYPFIQPTTYKVLNWILHIGKKQLIAMLFQNLYTLCFFYNKPGWHSCHIFVQCTKPFIRHIF